MLDFNSVLYQVLGQRIKERRVEQGLSQMEFSDRIPSLGRTSISNIEKGRQYPPLSTIYEICLALDIDIQSILPTYAEIESVINFSPENEKIERYISTQNLDEKTLAQIREVFKKNKK
ncbi:helix-turn-helix domain-containing protein [Flavobacterium subsaxonicum]|uniref:helix-turn-helix domain-containing protein n=1 Tax=Flavobacterium subsaxonicum TaxID=426226 RepID=UPI00047BE79F|nr:helix-turn-helix transcriptional regulator [Flavobacterium subsaxonicum]